MTLYNKVKSRVDDYIGFDSNQLFDQHNSLVRIFGGAVRDSISDKEIHDIDLLVGSKSIEYVNQLLKKWGYVYLPQLTPKDLSSIYTDIKIINEPHSWVKGDKIIQIIRPSIGTKLRELSKLFMIKEESYKQSFIDLIKNVDISCCGVSYDGERVYENFVGAIDHCLDSVFLVNSSAKMYSTHRILHRKVKLRDRGWKEIYSGPDVDRDIKINKILNKLDYTSET